MLDETVSLGTRHAADMPIAINKMCRSSDMNIQDIGLLLRTLCDLHVQRADDGLCDSCAGEWPCWTIVRVERIAFPVL